MENITIFTENQKKEQFMKEKIKGSILFAAKVYIILFIIFWVIEGEILDGDGFMTPFFFLFTGCLWECIAHIALLPFIVIFGSLFLFSFLFWQKKFFQKINSNTAYLLFFTVLISIVAHYYFIKQF